MVEQTVVLDLKLRMNVKALASKDRIDKGDFDTKAFAKRLRSFVEASRFQLIETLAEKVAQLILEEFPVGSVELRLSKPGAIRGADNVGVVIFRGDDL